MKRIFISLAALTVSGLLQAQTTLKATKPISKSDWDTYYNGFITSAYGTAYVVNYNGIAERLMGDKPANPQDKVSWRPPPIPPKDNPDNPAGVKPVKVKGGKVGSIKPKPIDPGCELCSVFIFPEGVATEVIQKVKNVLDQYK
jgi:hypothetical protein